MYQKLEKYDFLLCELEQLKAENARLKKLLQANGIAYEDGSSNIVEYKIYSDISFPDVHLGKDERVELFRSLFRGRDAAHSIFFLNFLTNLSYFM